MAMGKKRIVKIFHQVRNPDVLIPAAYIFFSVNVIFSPIIFLHRPHAVDGTIIIMIVDEFERHI